MAKQHTNPKVIVAAASGCSTSPWGVTFYGPMGHITLHDDGGHCVGGWASCFGTGGYTDPRVLASLQQAYRAHPALTGKPLPVVEIDHIRIDHIRIDCPDGEDCGTWEDHKVTDWLGNISYINKGYRAGDTWVSGWVG